MSEDLTMRDRVTHKLHPSQFSDMSGKMAAMVGCILDQAWTTPRITSMMITSDGHVLTDTEYLGSAQDWDRNLTLLLDAAELTDPEREWFMTLYRRRVPDWRSADRG